MVTLVIHEAFLFYLYNS